MTKQPLIDHDEQTQKNIKAIKPTSVRDAVMGGVLLGGGLWLFAGWVIGFVSGVDQTVFLLDMRLLPGPVRTVLIGALSIGSIYLGWGPNKSISLHKKLRKTLSLVCFIGFGTSVFNAAMYWKLLAFGQLFRGAAVPFSVFVSITGVFAVLMLKRAKTGVLTPPGIKQRTVRVFIALIVLLLGPLLLMHQFGTTDYRRDADAVVVFGARVYADGTPSLALEDRIRTGCQLIQEGTAQWLIASGGPGDGDVTEAQAMRAYAIAQGVAPEQIIMDDNGLNTALTCANTTRLMQADWRLLAVSHSYHLPRVKLAYQQVGLGGRVRTVPAQTSRPLAKMPIFMAREVAAWWLYFFEPVLPGSRAVHEPMEVQEPEADSSPGLKGGR